MTSNVILSSITLYSVDPFKTAEFYNTLGLHLNPSYGWTGYESHLDILEREGQKVFFKIHSAKSPNVIVDRLGFKVENVAETLKKLIELGVDVLRPTDPRVQSHCTIAEIRDPDGRSVTLYQF